MNKEFFNECIGVIIVLLTLAGLFITGFVAGAEHARDGYKKSMIESNMAEYRINSKTGERTFYIFERE